MRPAFHALTVAAGVLAATIACGGSVPSPEPTPGASTPPPASGAAFFPAAATWYADISRSPLDRDSAAVTAYLDRVGWGTGRMQIDFSIEVLEAALAAADEIH